MFDKDTFVKYMNEIIEQHDAIEELYDCFDKVFGSGDGIISNVMSVSLPVKILADAMNDTNKWIEHYVYECGCGSWSDKILIDDKEVAFETIEDLWNVLTT